ncbi:lipoamide acyltransferase component of branched-chain alpha-keto acid dehydrogenase complex, mitochondrial-like [Ascaphus truei]|uniref:lipoamide acyltransferase component of branched-chain alpha-keto acid dehydrogenase complex, mitochondrial-like n=1 Tax=Ascaphus truei TaxID=8439 RepID=UPI003F5ABA1E
MAAVRALRITYRSLGRTVSVRQLRSCSRIQALRLSFLRLSAPGGIQHRLFRTASSLNGQIVQFKLSDIGEGITEVTVKDWYVKEGDTVVPV